MKRRLGSIMVCVDIDAPMRKGTKETRENDENGLAIIYN